MIRKPDGSVSNYGYVMFKREVDAEKAINMSKIEVGTNTIIISPFKNKNFKSNSTTNKKQRDVLRIKSE